MEHPSMLDCLENYPWNEKNVVILSAAKDLLLHFYVFGWNTLPCSTALKIALGMKKMLSS
jgi:hypothetical protein